MPLFRSSQLIILAGALALSLFFSACKTLQNGGSAVKLAPLSKSEAQSDYNTLTASFQSLYGPLPYKQDRFHFKYNDLVAKYQHMIQASAGDVDTYGALKMFLASFHDGHVNIAFNGNATGIQSYDLGVSVTPVEGHVLVAEVGKNPPEAGMVQIGDELLAIDGVAPGTLLPTLLKYESLATDLSDQHLIYMVTHRPFYIKELIPKSDKATLTLARADGSRYEVVTPWKKTPTFDETQLFLPNRIAMKNFSVRKLYHIFGQGSSAETTIVKIGMPTPFFVTPQVTAALKLTPVTLTKDYLTKYKLGASATLPVAYTYSLGGKTILLMRMPSYDLGNLDIDTLVNGYRAIMDRYQNYVDVLVVDQTHNPGGDLDYVTKFFQLFLNGPANNQVEHLHVDRKWVYDMQQQAQVAASAANMASYSTDSTDAAKDDALQEAGLLANVANTVDSLTSTSTAITPIPYPLSGLNTIRPDATFTWKKPLLVLVDELAGSCGDIFPMLVQRNHVAKIFGQTTMGLGGNVDDGAIALPYSQATVDITRGLYTTYRPDGTYSNADLMENNGVTPDISYTHTVNDFRAGYVNYVQTFSASALAQIPSGAASSVPMPADFSTPPPTNSTFSIGPMAPTAR